MIRVYFKRGDQQVAKGKEHLAYKNGDAVAWLDTEISGEFKESEKMTKTFTSLVFPKSYLPFIKTLCSPIDNTTEAGIVLNDSVRRPCSKRMDYKVLEQVTGLSNLENKIVKSGDAIESIDCSKGIDRITELFKDSSLETVRTKDINAITTGSYTFGTGADYNLLSLLLADVSNLTGDLKATQTTDIADSTATELTVNIYGHTLEITSKPLLWNFFKI